MLTMPETLEPYTPSAIIRDMSELTILIDEHVERLDQKLTRVSVCAVEVPDEAVKQELIESMRILSADTLRFGEPKKFHFSSFSEAQRFMVTEVFSKINLTAKIYVYYYYDGNEVSHKIDAVRSSIRHLKYIHRRKRLNIQVEHADEYTATPLRSLLVKDRELFLAPDSFLSIFTGKLNNTSRKVGANDRMYTLIREKIRLQVFHFVDKKFYLISDKRI